MSFCFCLARPSQNFFVSIFEAQYGRKMTLGDGSATQLGKMTDDLNMAFSVVFIFELFTNILAHWPRAFIFNAWVRQYAGRQLNGMPRHCRSHFAGVHSMHVHELFRSDLQTGTRYLLERLTEVKRG